MKTWIYRKEYTSPEIVNKILALMGNTVLRSIVSDIQSSSWFSIIANEATDISRNEQMSLSIRWTNNYQIYEECLVWFNYLGLLKDVLIRCSLSLGQCRGQVFDGAANMSGVRCGVQALVKKEESRALYVHCLAHSLNLSIQSAAKNCE